MPFVSPQLASTMKDDFDPADGLWSAEEKFDGHRIIIDVSEQPTLFGHRAVRAWSRHGRDRTLPSQIREAMEQFPPGTYDGEMLVPGERSYGVTVIEDVNKLVYMMFDVVSLLGRDTTVFTYDERRMALKEIFGQLKFTHVHLAVSRWIKTKLDIADQATSVWESGGEGLILKKRNSVYIPGKRPKTWLKVKQTRSAVLTVIGFREGEMSMNSIVMLRDDEGNETTVKWKNYEELDKIDADPGAFVGKKLRIDFQERTPDGGYRHPRWDRWEE